MENSSRIPGFYRKTVSERLEHLAAFGGVSVEELSEAFLKSGLSLERANQMIENVVGTMGLPMGVAPNFLVNEKSYVVPMVVEEPSVVAAAANAAKMIGASGGFRGGYDEHLSTAQIQVREVSRDAVSSIERMKQELLATANVVIPGIVQRGGGAKDIEVRYFAEQGMAVIHVYVDCCDAMGANLLNTVAEKLGPMIAKTMNGKLGLQILSNLSLRRVVTIRGTVSAKDLGMEKGNEALAAIVSASRFATLDPFRAATHNKGVMNGVDSVLLATGNDWRGVEAGAHAFAAHGGHYSPLATWSPIGEGKIEGTLRMPLAVATVGGAIQAHPTAQMVLRLLRVKTAQELGCVVAATGLASNFAALRALSTEGIQRGHMRMHRRLVESVQE